MTLQKEWEKRMLQYAFEMLKHYKIFLIPDDTKLIIKAAKE